MQGRRVGTLTLGLVFIVIGIVYLLINIFNLHFDVYIIKLWPLVLISLGIEVLVYNYYSIKEKFILKFDGISIFLIGVILIFSFGIYVFGKFSMELLDPSSPLFYKKHVMMHLSYISMFL